MSDLKADEPCLRPHETWAESMQKVLADVGFVTGPERCYHKHS